MCADRAARHVYYRPQSARPNARQTGPELEYLGNKSLALFFFVLCLRFALPAMTWRREIAPGGVCMWTSRRLGRGFAYVCRPSAAGTDASLFVGIAEDTICLRTLEERFGCCFNYRGLCSVSDCREVPP